MYINFKVSYFALEFPKNYRLYEYFEMHIKTHNSTNTFSGSGNEILYTHNSQLSNYNSIIRIQ